MFCQLFMFFSVLSSASETSTIEPELTCYTSKGENYRGTIARTVSDKTCQNWSAQTPHINYYPPEKYPHAGLDRNYCRNPDPDNDMMPWCYTITDTRWEYCLVPRCEDVPRPEPKQVFKVKVTPDDPTVDLNDPAAMEAIVKQMKEKLKQQGVSGDVKLTWKKQPGGKVFKKEEKNRKKKTEL